MEIISRRYNSMNEYYCVSVKTLKETFKDKDIKIFFGLQKSFMFDSKSSNHPKINGQVVVQLSINNRLNHVSTPILSIYTYYKKVETDLLIIQEKFNNDCLPIIKNYYESKYLNETIPNKVYQLIIEKIDDDFKVHEMSFQ